MNKTLKNAFRLDLSVSYREVQSKEEGNSVVYYSLKENIVMKYETVEVMIAFSKIFFVAIGGSKNCTNEYIKNPVAATISKKTSPL